MTGAEHDLMDRTRYLDLLVVGSGVAGLSAAVRAADSGGLEVGVLTKGQLDQATTGWAQGGIAAVLGDTLDTTELHYADTLAAGAGLCDADAVRVLVDEGPARVKELIELGATFDRDPRGGLAVSREGGHSQARVVHAGGAATGREVERALVEAVRQRVTGLYEGWYAADVLVKGGRCVGLMAYPPAGGEPVTIRARHVLVATGGPGQLFAVTTNPAEATGDGIAMALRAGAAVADVEFVQFHPTALHHPVRPRPLLSEALRGEGAVLRDPSGERFVDELLPRDQVSRAITERMLALDLDHVWLDATAITRFGDRFPTIAAVLADAGLDPQHDWLPVAPAAHYMCGGIVVDLDGASSLPGLWAAGEVACGGVHGANRLASNSLLDGMVFGARVVEAIEAGKHDAEASGAMRGVSQGGEAHATRLGFDPLAVDVPDGSHPEPGRSRDNASSEVGGVYVVAALRARLQRVMTTKVGVVRSATSLEQAAATAIEIDMSARQELTQAPPGDNRANHELLNLALVGRAVCVAAAARRETRGAHARSDHPNAVDAFQRRLVLSARSPSPMSPPG